MKLLASIVLFALSAMVVGAAPPPVEVPVGKFETWLSSKKAPLHFSSGGLDIAVVPLPCPPDAGGDSTCNWEGYNNQAQVRVSVAGATPFTVTTDSAAESVRLAAVRLTAGDRRPAVIIDNDSGGSSGDSWVTVLVPTGAGFRTVTVTRRAGDEMTRDLQGEIADDPRDLSGDGVVDFVMEDSSFAYTFGCGACTPRPPVVLSVIDGKSVDLSADASVRAVFARDMVKLRPLCFAGGDSDRNGACAAYVADAARTGRLTAGWREMLAHYDRHPQWLELWQHCDVPPAQRPQGACPDAHSTHYRSFPESLRAFLVETKYITTTEAAALPIPTSA